ncbi:MAG: calcium-binding protein [Anaerolineales bacterium]
MRERKKNPRRENRIMLEIIVDAYGPEEQAMGWYSYLDDKLGFPFRARCIHERAISPLRKGEVVDVIGMAGADECAHEMFVTVRWEKRTLAVPLAQLKPTSTADAETKQATEDWHYWIDQGYEL